MKQIFSILTGVCLLAGTVSAQFVSPPIVKAGITNLPLMITSSNGATAIVPWSTYGTAPQAVIGANGIGLTINAGATNAAFTTNVWFFLETSGDGINYSTNQLITVCYLPGGTGYRPYYTNFATTVAGIGNATFIRLNSVLSTNGVVGGSLAGNLFITNFNFSTR